MAGWDVTPPGKDKDAQASHSRSTSSARFATDAPISASKFGREKLSFDDWSAPPVYALDEHASNKPTLFVGNLSWTITSSSSSRGSGHRLRRRLRGQAQRPGPVEGLALATFQSEEAVAAIAEFHGAVLEGRRLVVRPDQSEGDRQRAALAFRGLPRWRRRRRASSWGNRTLRDDARGVRARLRGRGRGARRAALGSTRRASRAAGLVRFKNAEAAEKRAGRAGGLEIGGRPARCKLDERPDDDAARGRRGRGRQGAARRRPSRRF